MQWVDNPIMSVACGHHAAASTPAFSAVQFLVWPSEFRLRPRGEMEGPSFASMVGGPFPSAVWGRGAEEGAESTGSVGLGVSFRGGGWLDRGWVDRVGTRAQTVHPGMGVVVQPQGWGPRTGHRPALTPGLIPRLPRTMWGLRQQTSCWPWGWCLQPGLGEWSLKLGPGLPPSAGLVNN